ncbi:LysR family transcriptional regulator [Clostridium carboxidivorans P7]|uniref:Molybdopterin molybdenumtransferase n=1 Tax=Clostridium carboxidivorans P7 TaxID=536227 RepID=C6PXF0_9CLOT|nr:molybdopterin biosynthesis protein [Clostridium carboxidivorans]AKN34172.1 LysR family transcriptional regulator [Clostridium carboxidivorans P7]EET86076.1 molybdenum cofactor synthesis domain protein [Clostridium carboxidivorans P7]EFG87499.1 molybdenum cofactor synthesis domain protein [Clostridium carboxidivorans P7]
MAQKVYLSNYEFKEALNKYLGEISSVFLSKEVINTEEGLGRVTAEAVYSKISSPFYNCSAMDGIALHSSKTIGASEKHPVVLKEEEDYIVVDTGDPVPKEYDCVIMVEDIVNIDENRIQIYKSAAPWQNIRPLGEDIVENQLIVPSGHVVRPVDIGAMLAGGINTIEVYKKPLVGIIPTGTELVEPGSDLKVGDIIDFNSRVFSAQVIEYGGTPKRYGIVKDDYETLKETLKRAVSECNIVIINAGSSAGREDFTSDLIADLGKVYVHGIAIKPGKPTIMGQIDNKPVLGIPGYPVSAYFIMEKVLKKIVENYQGLKTKEPQKVDAILSRRIMSSLKHLEFVRMKLGYVGNKIIATPLSRGAGATMSLVRADGTLEVPQNVEGIEAGTKVEINLMRDMEEIKNTIVCIGSHDPILDILSDMLHVRNKHYYLSSAHTGSMGGIMALKNEETHIAPIHLLDMETGEYNISYINKYLKNKNMALIKGVKRIQGLMVQKGNPLSLKSISDISEKNVRFVNRQRGAGTRLLLDYYLKKLHISPEQVNGYEREEFTHLSVAAAVANGDVDCGLGVYSAADMMGLDFIPVCNEEYDFAVPVQYLELDIIKELLQVMKSSEFLKKLDELGGYDYSDICNIAYI